MIKFFLIVLLETKALKTGDTNSKTVFPFANTPKGVVLSKPFIQSSKSHIGVKKIVQQKTPHSRWQKQTISFNKCKPAVI